MDHGLGNSVFLVLVRSRRYGVHVLIPGIDGHIHAPGAARVLGVTVVAVTEVAPGLEHHAADEVEGATAGRQCQIDEDMLETGKIHLPQDVSEYLA